LEGHTDYVHSLLFETKGAKLLSFGYAGNLKIWNLADGKPMFAERIGRIGNTAQYSADGSRVILASGDGTARVVTLPPAAR
jgi:WD40 repeat protein